MLHGKDTLFYSEKQATNKQQKGSLAPFQNIRQFVMNKGSGDDRDITREKDMEYRERWCEEMNTLVYFQMNFVYHIYIH